jgi:hypothetical protein
MVNAQEKLLPVRCLIDQTLLKRLKAWGRELASRPAVSVHYGHTLPLSYSARTALLIGLEELKAAQAPVEEYTLKSEPVALGVALPLWFKEALDSEAKRHHLSRVQFIRVALDKGLPQ